MAIVGMPEQIKSDDGVPGARQRKQAQRAKDSNPVRVSSRKPEVVIEPEQLELPFGPLPAPGDPEED